MAVGIQVVPSRSLAGYRIECPSLKTAGQLLGSAFQFLQRISAIDIMRPDPLFTKGTLGTELFRQWSACQNLALQYPNGDTWDRIIQQGIMLIDRFCQDSRVRIRKPRSNL